MASALEHVPNVFDYLYYVADSGKYFNNNCEPIALGLLLFMLTHWLTSFPLSMYTLYHTIISMSSIKVNENDKIKMNLEQFYTSRAWKHKRESILRRDGYLCRECRRYGRHTEATTVHHIIHYEDRPDLGLNNDNLISLCSACHNKEHPEKGQRFKGKARPSV